jgi:hypothetical protein
MTGRPSCVRRGHPDAPSVSELTQTSTKSGGQIDLFGLKRGQKIKWIVPLGWPFCPADTNRPRLSVWVGPLEMPLVPVGGSNRN